LVAFSASTPARLLDASAEISYPQISPMPTILKPRALRPGGGVRVLSLASPVKEEFLIKGCEELERLGYRPLVDRPAALARESFFAGTACDRLRALQSALSDSSVDAIFCSRGGYGSNYLLDGLAAVPPTPKILLGSSDITSLQIYLWQRFGWVTFYGPMVASNFLHGVNGSHGYEPESLRHAMTSTGSGWKLSLEGETLVPGAAEGILLGGCLTLIETTLGTPWELDTRGAILILEDRGMKPYQVDRSLMHLKQAGKFEGVKGIVLGDFPDCDAAPGDETVRDVAARILNPLSVPTVWGAAVGHTNRAALTLPLGVRASLAVPGGASVPQLEILEPACAT
jgi:muramoyltetrapeptide carboxypeptidase